MKFFLEAKSSLIGRLSEELKLHNYQLPRPVIEYISFVALHASLITLHYSTYCGPTYPGQPYGTIFVLGAFVLRDVHCANAGMNEYFPKNFCASQKNPSTTQPGHSAMVMITTQFWLKL